MKKIILFLFVSSILISCDSQQKNVNSDTNDPMSGYMVGNDDKSNAMVLFTKAYQDNDIESARTIFSDDVIFHINDSDLTFNQVKEGFSAGHDYFDNIRHSEYDVSTMYYNDGKIFTNYWYTWAATSKKSNEELVFKGYCWFKWENDKVVEVYNAFDPTAYNMEMSN